jgi:hypothetical protein
MKWGKYIGCELMVGDNTDQGQVLGHWQMVKLLLGAALIGLLMVGLLFIRFLINIFFLIIGVLVCGILVDLNPSIGHNFVS